jgi:hypothetical protein
MDPILANFAATGDTGVAPAPGKNANGTQSNSLFQNILSLGQSLGAAAPLVSAITGKGANGTPTQQVAAATTQDGQVGFSTAPTGTTMSQQTKLLIGGGVAVVVLIGVLVMLRKS